MAAARIRARDPGRIPLDLPFEVETVEQVADDDFPDPEDPRVLNITAPTDFRGALQAVKSAEPGQQIRIAVSDPTFLQDEEFAEIVREAGGDLVVIDVHERLTS